jgi:co-chaperonin GroES (HSP10)
MDEAQVQEIPEMQDKRRFDDAGVARVVKHTVQPRNQWVLIKKLEREEMRTEDGLILPGGGRSQRGRVVSVAKRSWLKRLFSGDLGLSIGDIVVYTNFPIELEDLEELTGESNLHLVREEEVYAVAVPCPTP